MPEPDEASLACIGCGAINPADAEVCSGCGHRFAGPSAEPPAAGQAPPTAEVTAPAVPRPRGERSIAAIAGVTLIGGGIAYFGLAQSAASQSVGILLLVAAVAAMVWTLVGADRSGRTGKPLRLGQWAEMFLMALLQTVAILMASLIAFVATCFPIGMFGFSEAMNGDGNRTMIIAIGSGSVAAALVAGWLVLRLRKRLRRRDGGKPPGEYQP